MEKLNRSCERLYLERKLGIGMDKSYILASITPLLLVFLITAVLTFSLVFISSLSTAIDRMIVLLGSSSLSFSEEVPQELLPENSTLDLVKRGEGILYSEDSESLVYIKGVEESFFTPERSIGLRFTGKAFEGNWIVLSSNLAEALGVAIDDRMTLLLYDTENSRTRPFLMTVCGIFDSGYAQLDRYLAFADFSLLLSSDVSYELLLPSGYDVNKVQEELYSLGFSSTSYKEEYSYLYQNVQQSIWILYIILVAVALLSAFFSVDVALVYISRDRQDIELLLLLGMAKNRVLSIYLKLSLVFVFISALLGVLLGIILGYLSPLFVKIISYFDADLLQYYVTSFTVDIPFLQIILMVILMLVLVFLSLVLIMKREAKEDLLLLVNNE